jgi:hypothetical protein
MFRLLESFVEDIDGYCSEQYDFSSNAFNEYVTETTTNAIRMYFKILAEAEYNVLPANTKSIFASVVQALCSLTARTSAVRWNQSRGGRAHSSEAEVTDPADCCCLRWLPAPTSQARVMNVNIVTTLNQLADFAHHRGVSLGNILEAQVKEVRRGRGGGSSSLVAGHRPFIVAACADGGVLQAWSSAQPQPLGKARQKAG